MKETILVTGSSGFLGERVCAELRKTGYAVNEFDLDKGQDILKMDQVTKALRDCSMCVHLAAVSDLYIADANHQQCRTINVDGTGIVAKACELSGARLIYASTCCVYGNNNEVISDETSPTKPTELYAMTKLEGEEVIRRSGCDFAITRIATFYGPKMRKSLATSIFLDHVVQDKIIEIHGDGKQTRSYTHVDDIAAGIRLVCQRPEINSIVNIASDTSYSVNELIEIIEEIVGKKTKRRFVKDREGQIRKSDIDSSLIQGKGWEPRWDLRSGMEDCYHKLYPK